MQQTDELTLELYEEIYKLRIDCGITRQNVWTGDLDRLDSELREELRLTHPYNLSHTQRESLQDRVAAFGQGGNGASADIATAGYLYRVANTRDIYCNINPIRVHNADIPDHALVQWNELYRQSNDGADWQQLSEYGEKDYSAYSGISWWTTDNLDESVPDIFSKTTKIGLFENWVTEKTYLLRCPVEFILASGIVNVPTAVDAFASSVFHTTENAKKPREGVTIDLSKLPVRPGCNEYVVRKIDLSYIEIKPVWILKEHRERFNKITSDSLEILSDLINYYKKLP